MENKEIDVRNIWDYAYVADNDNRFNPVPYKISLSKGEDVLEYDSNSGYLRFYNDSTSKVLDLDTEFYEFLEYVAYRFNIGVPKYNIITDKYKDFWHLEFFISKFGLKNGYKDFIQFFMYAFYDTDKKTVDFFKKYNFRIEYE